MNKRKKILFYFFISLMFLPLIEMKLNFFEIESLKGSYQLEQKPSNDSIITQYLNKSYQAKYDKYFNDFLGFRSFLVRLNNQIQFSLFNKVHTDNAIVGRNNCMLDEKYIFAYYGDDYLGKEYIISQTEKLRYVQYKLKKKYDIDLLVIFAPAKTKFYEKNTPNFYLQFKRDSNNYNVFKSEFNSNKINFIDFYKMFEDINDTSKYDLFPRYGVHWNAYGYIPAADSLINYIANSNKKLNIPKLKITDIIHTDSVATEDKDIEWSMNLLLPVSHKKMAYPKYEIENIENKNLKLLTIADSYYNAFYNSHIIHDISEINEYYYYNKIKRNQNDKKLDYKNYLNEIVENYNYIILLSTELNYWNIGHGFIEQMYDELLASSEISEENDLYLFYKNIYYLDSLAAIKKAKFTIANMQKDYVNYKEARIKIRKNYYLHSVIHRNELIEEAKIKNIDLNTMAYRKAVFFVSNNLEINKKRELKFNNDTNSEEINKIIEHIKSDKDWYSNIKSQAKESNVPVEEMLIKNAKYTLKERNKR